MSFVLQKVAIVSDDLKVMGTLVGNTNVICCLYRCEAIKYTVE